MAKSFCIQCRVSPETKRRVSAVAAQQQLSESALLLRMLEGTIAAEDGAAAPAADCDRQPRAGRLSVSLLADDLLLLRERARARKMPSATYVSALVRAHLRAVTPVPVEEHKALRAAIHELTTIGRNLNQLALGAQQGRPVTGLPVADFRHFLKVCEALRDHTKALLRRNVESWKSGVARET